MNSSSNSTSISQIFDSALSIYVIFVEPILGLAYVWLMWTIGRSHQKELHSSFYRFFIFTDFISNFIMFSTHWFSLSHTVGKVLVVASRFTVICFPLSLGDFWTPYRVKIAAILMFTVPALLNSFVLPMDAKYRYDDKGNKIHAGVANWAMQVLKFIACSGYLFFLVITTPMCAVSMYMLRQAQRFNKDLAKQERALLIHTVITTTAHMIKSAQQIFSLTTLVMGNAALNVVATNMYNLPNTLTTFVPPILLIITSTPVRNEILCGRLRPLDSSNSNTATIVSSLSSETRNRQTMETTL